MHIFQFESRKHCHEFDKANIVVNFDKFIQNKSSLHLSITGVDSIEEEKRLCDKYRNHSIVKIMPDLPVQ